MKLVIGYLYPDLMNIYGDTGNIIALKKRAEWRGIEVEVRNISLDNQLDTFHVSSKPDVYFFGGGQDQQQEVVAKDLEKSGKGKVIRNEIERGVPLLAICGGYQLLGQYYKPFSGPKLPGVGLFPTYTIASDQRMIGNIVISVQGTGYSSPVTFLVGFENHSGKTYLRTGAKPLGKVIKGFGNNGEDKLEGCIYKNAIGCYMHGSLLPKNPHLADYLLKKALEVKYGSPRGAGKGFELEPLDNSLETKAHDLAIQRFV